MSSSLSTQGRVEARGYSRASRIRHFCSALLLLVLLPACVLVLPAMSPTPTSGPSATPPPTASPAHVASDLHLTADAVVLLPGPEFYSGDVVTFDVTPRNLGDIIPEGVDVHIYHQTSVETELVAAGVVRYPAFDDLPRARLVWAWDTAGLTGEETLTVWLDPEDRIQEGDNDPANNVVTLTVRLLSDSERPPAEVAASWATTSTTCCAFHYLTGTAADRDLRAIVATAERAVAHAQGQLGVSIPRPVGVYFISRVIGHGGYAQRGATLSYLDRHYAGGDLETVIRHEAAHVLDGKLSPSVEWTPTLLREGLAVWVAGGHFKPEPIPQRAAALVQTGWYVPLDRLADGFHREQHEIGYLEGAVLVTYLVETYGWESFRRFYTSFDGSHGSPAQALDAALRQAFGAGLAETEGALLRWLDAHPPTPDHVRDLEMTVSLFDTIRRYQQVYDPSAYYLTAWLPDPAEAERRGLVADFLRHPRTVENIALETMLTAAWDALQAGAFDRVEDLLDGVNGVLEGRTFSGSLAADYLAVVQAVAVDGLEVQYIELDGTRAHVWAVADWPDLTKLTLKRTGSGWALVD